MEGGACSVSSVVKKENGNSPEDGSFWRDGGIDMLIDERPGISHVAISPPVLLGPFHSHR